MEVISMVSSGLLAIGLYLIMSHYLNLPTYGTQRAMRKYIKSSRQKGKSFEDLIDSLAMDLAVFIRLSDYDRSRLSALLPSVGIKLFPETYVARAYVKAALLLLLIIPALILLPLAFPFIILLALGIYFKERSRVEEVMRIKREAIEAELPRFVSTLAQELKAGRNILSMLESYKKGAGPGLKSELEITIADMRSGSYELALSRMANRISSPKMSEVISGLRTVLNGNDGVVHFQILAHDLKYLELQKLKTKAMKQPGRIRKYSFAMLACFLLMYMGVIIMQILETMEKLF